MELHIRHFVLVTFILPTFLTMTFADDFAKAREKINQAKPNIDYRTFCAEMKAGEDKIACRMKDVPSVGFLVCKEPEMEGTNCSTIINTEIGNLQKVQNEGKIKIVTISPPPIDGVRCGNDPSTECSGFLEEWLTTDKANFKQVRDHISNNTIPALIADVRSFTSETGLSTAADDLSNIKKYMMVNQTADVYRQICDLQGFFLVKGGFLVADVPYLLEDTDINGICWDGEPTTKQVLDALDKMISAFKGKGENLDAHNGVIIALGPEITTQILLLGLHTYLIKLFGRV